MEVLVWLRQEVARLLLREKQAAGADPGETLRTDMKIQ